MVAEIGQQSGRGCHQWGTPPWCKYWISIITTVSDPVRNKRTSKAVVEVLPVLEGSRFAEMIGCLRAQI